MLFSSMVFIWIFLPIVFIGNIILNKIGGNKLSNIFLLIASLFFYAWGEPIYILLMLVSISVNYLAGLALNVKKYKKIILVIDIVLNLGLLGFFKYTSMFIDTINTFTKSEIVDPQISLPIGISFFTFQALSYVIDVYKKETETQKNWFKLALYVSFFPQLIAGPIVKYKDINEQIDNREINITKTALGIRRFIYGFAKKVLLANVLGLCADRLYSISIENITSMMAWVASISYTLQIYYDFSGYSDMAIGLGKVFGFEFKENFNYPYKSCSIKEFWRRWHISLSSWFRDYVYIPLGGNRKGKVRTYINLLIVFLLTGLWHGASWTFVLWGIYHGLFIIIERLGFDRVLNKQKILSWLYTIVIVNFGWVLFRIDDIGKCLRVFKRMLIPWQYKTSVYSIFEFVSIKMIAIICIGVLGAGLVRWIGEKTNISDRWRYSYAEILYLSILLFLSIISLASGTYNPFIYFRF